MAGGPASGELLGSLLEGGGSCRNIHKLACEQTLPGFPVCSESWGRAGASPRAPGGQAEEMCWGSVTAAAGKSGQPGHSHHKVLHSKP